MEAPGPHGATHVARPEVMLVPSECVEHTTAALASAFILAALAQCFLKPYACVDQSFIRPPSCLVGDWLGRSRCDWPSKKTNTPGDSK